MVAYDRTYMYGVYDRIYIAAFEEGSWQQTAQIGWWPSAKRATSSGSNGRRSGNSARPTTFQRSDSVAGVLGFSWAIWTHWSGVWNSTRM